MALGSTQPLTEMTTRNISWGLLRPVLRADKPLALQSGCLKHLEPSGLSRPVQDLFYLYLKRITMLAGVKYNSIDNTVHCSWMVERNARWPHCCDCRCKKLRWFEQPSSGVATHSVSLVNNSCVSPADRGSVLAAWSCVRANCWLISIHGFGTRSGRVSCLEGHDIGLIFLLSERFLLRCRLTVYIREMKIPFIGKMSSWSLKRNSPLKWCPLQCFYRSWQFFSCARHC
jgi:hypothetical protein